ncbi:MAG: PEP-CTERM sorting domain-containing protein [Pseudomonadota bacterium]
MKFKSKFAAAVLSLFVAASAGATVLTFDPLSGTYGDGFPLGANMSTTIDSLSYKESGFVMTLWTPNAYNGAHIGDASAPNATYNWHDGSDNGTGAYITLSKEGGGLFSLINFDYEAGDQLSVSATGYATQLFNASGNASVNFNNVSEVRFYSDGNNYLDNIEIGSGNAVVPEPGTIAILLTGLGLIGAMARRKQ